MKRSFRTFNESVAHAASIAALSVSPSAFIQQMWMDYGPDHLHTWRHRRAYTLTQLAYAWDALMCAIKGHDMRCAADAESGHTEHWCERCFYSFDVWM
jgi:hypothetical protein